MKTESNLSEIETPASMIPAQGKAYESTPNELDYLKIVSDCAKNKNGSFRFDKGNGLFNAACLAVKSYRQISKGTRLDEVEAIKIRQAVDLFAAQMLSQINAHNLVSSSKTLVIRSGEVVEKLTQVGINKLSWEKQIETAKNQLAPLRELRIKVVNNFGDPELVDKKIAKWQAAILWAEFQLSELQKALKKSE